MLLFLGNSNALEPQEGTSVGGETPEQVSIPGDQITTVEIPGNRPLDEALTEIKNIWNLHSADSKPTWVDGNDDLLVRAVANTFDCPIGNPDEVGNEEETHAS